MTKPTHRPVGRPSKSTTRIRATANNDGWANVLTGLGAQQDPHRNSFSVSIPNSLTERELTSIFLEDGLGRRIVETPADEAVGPWFLIVADDGSGELVNDELETLNAQCVVTEAYTWSRLYGGAMIIRLLDDGQDLDQPLDYNRLQRVIGYRLVDRYRVTYTELDLCTDASSLQYAKPMIYTVSPICGMPYRVHASRVAVIDGRRVPDLVRQNNQGWGASCLQGAYTQLKRLGTTMGYSESIIRDFVQTTLSVKGLGEMFAAGEEATIKTRLQLIDLTRSSLNTIILDADGEQYAKQASSVAGLTDLIGTFREDLSSVTGIPMTKLFGTSAGGLNATGEGDMRNYYDMLDADRTIKLNPVLEVMIKDIYLSKQGPTSGNEPANWSMRWNSLWQPSDKEIADLRKVVADTDAIYLDRGVLSPEEVTNARFSGAEWSQDILVDTSNA